MIIECPDCKTRYEIAAQAIGRGGRPVQCAKCACSWQASPLPDEDTESDADTVSDADSSQSLADLLDDEVDPVAPSGSKQPRSGADVEPDTDISAGEEHALDDQIVGAGEAGEGSVPDPSAVSEADSGNVNDAARRIVDSINKDNEEELSSYAERRRQQIDRMKSSRRIAKRRREIARALPLARLRRNTSYAALATTAVFVGFMAIFQTKLVQAYPDLAGFYRLLGQQVNVVGLNFVDVNTDRIWRNGNEVLAIKMKIVNETRKMTPIRPVRVALVSENDEVAYEWNSIPDIAVLEGEGVFDFKTELISPPADIKTVRLRFLEWRNRPSGKAPTKSYEDVKLGNSLSSRDVNRRVFEQRLRQIGQHKSGE